MSIEFAAEFDMILDSEGHGHIEKILFEVYYERVCLIEAVERFSVHRGYYPKRVLVA